MDRPSAIWIPMTCCALAGAARAETVCRSYAVPNASTNWQQTIAIERFDPALGFLSEVRLRIDGTVIVEARVESLDATPSTLTVTRSGAATWRLSGGAVLLSVVPADSVSTSVSAYDGVIDFGGTSGFSLPAVALAQTSTTIHAFPGSTANLFVGPPGNPGNVFTAVDAVGSSVATGAGNLITSFTTSASATVEVCYVFEPDCNANGVRDSVEIANGTSLDANGNGVPDECDYSFTGGLCPGDGSGSACPCNNTSAPGGGAGCSHSLGSGGLLVGSGVARISADTVLLSASALPTTSSTLFFQGTATLGGDLGAPFGDGLRCAGGTIRRLATLTAQNGTAAFPPPGSPGVAAEGAVTPGARTYQVWYRNAAAFCTPSTFNLTNGVRIVWGV